MSYSVFGNLRPADYMGDVILEQKLTGKVPLLAAAMRHSVDVLEDAKRQAAGVSAKAPPPLFSARSGLELMLKFSPAAAFLIEET